MTVNALLSPKKTKLSLALFAGFLMFIVTDVVYSRHIERESRLHALDQQELATKIRKLEQTTTYFNNTQALSPVWVNWNKAKDIAQEFGVTLRPTKNDRSTTHNIWSGQLTGDGLTVLAVAKRIQQQVAAELGVLHYLGSKAQIDVSIIGARSSKAVQDR